MMQKKKLCMINWLSKSMLLKLKIPSTSGLVTKTQYDLDKHGLQKNIEDIDKNITNASGPDKNAY